ncbi:MAG: hypothetical protein KGL16_10770, partial [Acidobacteriota bacterium]|nr:hypothetical protein [Acidobacteriota bacterium]
THLLGYHASARVSEIEIVANTAPPGANQHWLCWWGAGCNLYPSRLQASYAITGFHAAGRTRVKQFTILRLIAATPHTVTRGELHRAITAAGFFGLLTQRP